jgi:repressor LexA
MEIASPAELRALTVILNYAESGEQIPNQEQLARDIGISAKSRVSEMLASLERKGFITSDKTRQGKIKTRTIRLNKMERTRPVPVLGRVAAGRPILADGDDIMGFISLPSRYVRDTNVYMLKVQGESMEGDGICDGDYVIVAPDQELRRGDIAVVLVGGEEATVKHVYYEGEKIRLKSSNPHFKDQVYGESDRPVIQGKVIGVIRWPT